MARSAHQLMRFWPASGWAWRQAPASWLGAHELASSGCHQLPAPTTQPRRAFASGKEPETPLLRSILNRMLVSSSWALTTAAALTAASAETGGRPPSPTFTTNTTLQIRGGPLSVAEYMQEVLTNPSRGVVA